MYESFYGFRERPFRLTPDPRFLFLSNKHKEAFAHLLYGIKYRSGFVQITGEIGTGKTMICRTLLRQVDPDTKVAYIFNPCLSDEELLKNINEEFGIRSTAVSKKELIDELNGFLLEQRRLGKGCVLVIDEAQNLTVQVLEQIRLLSNLETETEKLLQIMLIGQPELDDIMMLPEMRQLAQRVTARYHLLPLERTETTQYIAHRLRKAGGRDKVKFTRGALNLIYKFSGGTPRLINAVCDRTLLVGYTLEKRQITSGMVKRAISEVEGERKLRQPSTVGSGLRRAIPYAAATVAVALFAGSVYLFHLSTTAVERPADLSIMASSKTASAVSDFDVQPMFPMDIERSGVEPPKLDEPVEAAEPTDQIVEVPMTIMTDVSAEFHRFAQQLEYRSARLIALNAMLMAWNRKDGPDPATSVQPSGLYEIAQQHGLRCYDMRANMSKLRVLNLPCILQIFLPGDDRRPFYLALTSLDGGKASIVTNYDGDVQQFDIEVLERYWYGRAFVFWEEFEPLDPLMTLGSIGPSVAWLQNELARLAYYSGAVTAVYDESTARAVALFQRRYRLLADGKVGPETRMAMYGASGRYVVPHLIPDSKLIVVEDSGT